MERGKFNSLFTVTVAAPLMSLAMLPRISFAEQSATLTDSDLRSSVYGSEFEGMVQLNHGRIPYPYQSLLGLVGKFNNPGFIQVATVAIPDGRSLVKIFADYQSPRFVTSASEFSVLFNTILGEPAGVSSFGASALFIGYAPRSNELEVISWDQFQSKFDFLIVDDYRTGATPTVRHADEKVCLACHQNGGPIFSNAGWNESRGASLSTLAIAAQYKAFGASGKAPPFIDKDVRAANDHLQVMTVFRSVCGESLKCRQILFLTGLASSGALNDPKYGQSFSSKISLAIGSMIKGRWPGDGFAYPSDVLPNRIPRGAMSAPTLVAHIDVTNVQDYLAGFSSIGTGDLELNQIANELKNGVDMAYNHVVVGGFDPDEAPPGAKFVLSPESGTPSFGNPLIKRPKVSAIPPEFAVGFLMDNAHLALGLNPDDDAYLKNISFDRLQNLVQPNDGKAFLQTWPPSHRNTMAFVKNHLSNDNLNYDATTTERQSPLVLKIQSPQGAMPTQPAIKIFVRYCGSCHQGPSATVEDFKIQNIGDLQKFNGPLTHQTPLAIIQSGAMPADIGTYDQAKLAAWLNDKKVLIRALQN